MSLNATPLPLKASKAASGTAVAPGAASNFVSLTGTTIEAGEYQVDIYWTITGAQETAANNIRLMVSAGAVCDVPTAMAFGGADVYHVCFPRLTHDGVNAMQLRAIANAVASTVYTGVIVATRIG